MHRIVVPVRGDGKGDNVFAHAAALARRFRAHVSVTHCRPRPEDLLPYGVPIPAFMHKELVEQSKKVADQEEKALQKEVEALAKKFGLAMATKPSTKKGSVSWVEEAGKQVDVIKRHGRLADLIAVAQPDIDRNLGSNTLKAALFHTGRPVMMCPPSDQVPDSLGETVTIGWSGSMESSRAVAMTQSLLQAARSVTILVSGDEHAGTSAADLKAYLALKDVDASVERFTTMGNVGSKLLEQSAQLGSSLLIMGAYGDSHEHETLFGGNTQAVVDGARMPVIFVH